MRRQTRYRSPIPKNDRTFDSRLLNSTACSEKHFTIRLKDYGNRTDGRPIVWGAVIGLAEEFSVLEFIEFPLYILRNHGHAWNEMSWTVWLVFFVLAPALIAWWRHYRMSLCEKPLSAEAFHVVMTDAETLPRVSLRIVEPREVLYDFAILFFVAAGLEELLHLVYSSAFGAWDEFLPGLLILFIPNGAGVWFTSYVWQKMRDSRKKPRWKPKPGTPFFVLIGQTWKNVVRWEGHGHPYWAPLEVFTGFTFLLLLGAGFWGGPICIMIAGCIRASELCIDPVDSTLSTQYSPAENAECAPVENAESCSRRTQRAAVCGSAYKKRAEFAPPLFYLRL